MSASNMGADRVIRSRSTPHLPGPEAQHQGRPGEPGRVRLVTWPRTSGLCTTAPTSGKEGARPCGGQVLLKTYTQLQCSHCPHPQEARSSPGPGQRPRTRASLCSRDTANRKLPNPHRKEHSGNSSTGWWVVGVVVFQTYSSLLLGSPWFCLHVPAAPQCNLHAVGVFLGGTYYA